MGPRGLEMAVVFTGADSQLLATVLHPFQIIFDELEPDRIHISRPALIGVAGLSHELPPKLGFLNLFGHNGPLA